MGLIICDAHGSSGIVFVCPHIEELLSEREKINNFTVANVDVGDVGAVTKHIFCSTCVTRYNFPHTDNVLPDSIFDEYEEAFSITQPYCSQCASELIQG